MKKTRVWLMAILLILQCCIMGCAQSDNGKGDTAGEVSSISTTAQTTVNTTASDTTTTQTTAIQPTIRITTEGPPGGSVAHKEFESVEELLGWIHNGKDAPADLFRVAIQSLKLDRLLIIEAADDVFTLEFVRTFQRGSGWDAQIEYYFISEKGERVCLYVHLRDMHAPVDHLKKYVESINQSTQKKYPTKKGPMLYAADDVHLLGKSRQTYVREYGYAAQGCIHEPVYARFVTDIDGFLVEGVLDGSLRYENWDNAYLNHFKFSYRDITIPTTNAATITNAASSGENDKEDTVAINVGEYFAASGKRMVDLKDVSKDEFLKKYPIILPENFTTVDFYYEIPIEDGVRFNEVEDGYVRCESNDGRSNLYVYVCDTKYIGHSCIWNRNAEPKKSRINNVDVIISQQKKGVYRGQFEKNGYYYTFETSNMAQQDAVSALKDLTGGKR